MPPENSSGLTENNAQQLRCHLPSTFHFRWSWDVAMAAMNLKPGDVVTYGRVYSWVGPVSSDAARRFEQRSKRWFGLIERMPGRIRGRVAQLLIKGLQ